MKKNGFTLIELLAVIVILGIILVIAIPSISKAILNSRKNAYVATANEFVDGLRMMTLTDASLLPSSCKNLSDIKLEKGSNTKSPFGKAYTSDSQVCVSYNETTKDYDYKVCLVDTGGNSICTITTSGGTTTYNPIDIKTVTKETVAINGNIPIQEEPSYVNDGLMLYLDGINNLGTGDTNHSSSTTTWYDLSGNNRNFTAANSGTFQNNYYVSNSGNCWYLNTTAFNSLSTMTVEVVGQIDSAGKGYSYVVANRSEPNYNWMFAMKYNQFMPHGSAQYLDSIYFTYGNPFTAVMQINSGSLKTYVNNTISQTNTAFTYGNATSKITVGCYHGGAYYGYLEHFYGRIYAIRIYNRALSETELTNNHDLDVTRFGL